MILLDTDHLSLLQWPDSKPAQTLSQRLISASDQLFGTTAITLDEQLRGWLALLNRYREVRQQTYYYEQLVNNVRFYNQWTIIGFDSLPTDTFQRLQKDGIRIGTNDLKIAAIALSQDALLLTRNHRHFERVPGLWFEDWSSSPNQP